MISRRLQQLAASLVLATSLTDASGAADSLPNVIILLFDDLGYHDLGFQGSKEVKTPHLDKLAAGGIVFTDGHVTASVCSPSRAGLLTGRYQQRFGHEANTPPMGKGMDLAEKTMGDHFKALGYTTAVLGKWHVGSSEEYYPTRRGFDEFIGLREGHRKYWYDPKGDDKPGSHKAIEHNGKQIKFDGYLTDWFGEQAVEFVTTHKDDPFLLYFSFTAPHGPIQAKPEDLKTLKTDNEYAAMIHAADRSVGRLVEALEKNGQMDNTLIWFLSDNGGVNVQASNAPLTGNKGTVFEGGMRVPFFVHWKGKVPAGRKDSRMVTSLDILPTSLIAAGGALPTERPLDGTDLMPYLTDHLETPPHPEIYWRRLNIAAVRKGQWKLIRVDEYGNALYDLSTDLGEKHDLAKSHPEKVAQLEKELEKWESNMVKPKWTEGQKWEQKRLEAHKALIGGLQPKN